MTDRTGIGGNSPPAFEAFSMALDDVYVEAQNWLDGAKVESQAQADAIGTIMATARQIKKDADAARADEKRPHDEAGKAVQEKWRPLLTRADNIVSAAQKPLTAFMEAEQARQRVAAEEARKEALRLQQEAQEARQASAGNLAATEQAEALQKDADRAIKAAGRAEKAKPNVAGMDRAIGLRPHWEAEVVDRRAALNHFIKRSPERFEALVQQLADEEARGARAPVPGVTFHERKRAA